MREKMKDKLRKAYRWTYRRLTWCTVEQACSDAPMPWWNQLCRKWVADPDDYGSVGGQGHFRLRKQN